MDMTTDALTSISRLLLIIVLSSIVGFEREIKNHPAGLRTHILVGLGACLLMLLSLYGFSNFIATHKDVTNIDPARLPSYVIAGIGFLGAGTIIVRGDVNVKGLTTAASIWVVAGIGLVVGAGMYLEAIVTTFLVLIVLFVFNKVEDTFLNKNQKILLLTITTDASISFANVFSQIEEGGVQIIKSTTESQSNHCSKYTFLIKGSSLRCQAKTIETLQQLEAVVKVSIEKNE
ncbi:MgtC/SapB family protein [Bacillus solitudinis]|uniref:MgtC/SapB family protein n=1 Tax=Bacillus solitudinis TaxID=2014074 RepID=UPI000C24CE05|nr:MgtC/SapB family protein [Bacillus solitudinis]